ncbi:NAD(P)/FAD-dependent oxidoreductase [Jannaschia rubra]|uniref:NAD(P)/FAD-dependent oxidoreductase n=1 Tax=Jannaschia rubra TaxID=282197 RepID=UPI002491ACD6|nr:FAD-dependent oxidoreductase [Jannaschia rubra]
MPPAFHDHPLRRIAIVGAGIGGMIAAHALAPRHRVTLFEAESRAGGHARTILAGRNGDRPVDTGFIVWNRANYPNLVALFDDLGVPVAESDMSFAASLDGGRVEYSLRTADTMFAQRRNLLSPRFLRMVRDIFRFNAHAADAACDPDLPLGAFLDRLGMGPEFRDWYLAPISGAIWSTPTRQVMEFPAQAMMRFFRNHNLLSHKGQHQWYTVRGGSAEYVARLTARLARMGVEQRLGTPVRAIRRDAPGVEVLAGQGPERFDDVVLATHADDSLRLLADPRPHETALLSRVRFQDNEAVLHADPSVMPRRRKVWAAWNYAEQAARPDRIGLTYWMNRLQPIPQDDPLFSTLNPQRPIREDLIHDVTTFRHPVYDLPMMQAVEGLRAANGTDRTWFCGAWMRNGFHEDGFVSALDVADAMAARDPVQVAAE